MSIKKHYKGPGGLKQFGKDMGEWAKKEFAGKGVRQSIINAMAVVTREAKRRAPVGVKPNPGELRRSIAFTASPRKTGRGWIGAVGSDVEHSVYVEFGTKHIDIGSPASPRTSWPAKEASGTGLFEASFGAGAGETMPYLRAAIYAKRRQVIKALKEGVA